MIEHFIAPNEKTLEASELDSPLSSNDISSEMDSNFDPTMNSVYARLIGNFKPAVTECIVR